MSRSDEYMESMLRDLGSVYYQTLLGEASEADVARAVQSVRSREAAGSAGPNAAGAAAGSQAELAGRIPGPRQGRWRVIDVMSAGVVAADKNMTFKEVARLLAENALSSVPVVSGGGHVLGVISEADVLRKEERLFSRFGSGLPHRTHRQRRQARALTAGELMSTPAITIHPDAPLGAAARLMNGRRVRCLPVVDSAKELIGMLSRRDLLAVYLRPDADISADVNRALASMQGGGLADVSVSVADGEVTLSGRLPRADLVPEAVRIASDVDGVVTVISELTA